MLNKLKTLFLVATASLYFLSMTSGSLEAYENEAPYFSNAQRPSQQEIEYCREQADFHMEKAFYFVEEGRWAEAITHFDLVIVYDPEIASFAYAGRGFCYGGLEDWHKSLEDLNQAIRLNPKVGRFYQMRACAYERLGNEKAGRLDYITAARLGDQLARAVLRQRGISW